MRSNLLLIFTAAVLFAISQPAFAHHGAAAYDSSRTVTVTGTVTDFQFINPHVLIAIDAKDPSSGQIEKWQGELTSPNHLSRAGWTRDTLKPGDVITMSGAPLKDGQHAMAIHKLEKNGEELPTRES